MTSRSIDLASGWAVVQDIHDSCEALGVFRLDWDPLKVGPAVSGWEPIPRLAHLQLLLARQPYFGRELRHFNEHAWFYRLEFDTPDGAARGATLRFEGVDYFAKVWLNERLLGEHEGYSEPFEFEVGPLLRADGKNALVVKVSSPWDRSCLPGEIGGRSWSAVRNMLKGTYEHADTFVQRDVNPVGIWAPVRLVLHDGLRSAGRPAVTAAPQGGSAKFAVSWPVALEGKACEGKLSVRIISVTDGRVAAQVEKKVRLGAGASELSAECEIPSPLLWSTWDRGRPNLYRAEMTLSVAGHEPLRAEETFGIRSVSVRRTADETTFLLNGEPIFLRGTCYFPDVYVSALDQARAERDVRAMVAAGVNAVRVHVHTQPEWFYDACDRLGLFVIQDSDFNWVHPADEAFAKRAVAVFEGTIRKLRNHPCVSCWICMNEPAGGAKGEHMKTAPGPQLLAATRKLDPTRPTIKGSFFPEDLESGDSHNYAGSLGGKSTRYTDIFGTTEKLNTEFGFDAPPPAARLRLVPEAAARLSAVLPRVSELHDYQYRLLKYFIEHYRIQKYAPCSGYFQFMWVDLCPQSFYGVYDWWGLPKTEGLGGGLRALDESNMPVGIFMEHKDSPVALWAVNDTLEDLGECSAEWSAESRSGRVEGGCGQVRVLSDCRAKVCELKLPFAPAEVSRVRLTLRDSSGRLRARNEYVEPFNHPARPEGHPQRMEHEIGMRLYWG